MENGPRQHQVVTIPDDYTDTDTPKKESSIRLLNTVPADESCSEEDDSSFREDNGFFGQPGISSLRRKLEDLMRKYEWERNVADSSGEGER